LRRQRDADHRAGRHEGRHFLLRLHERGRWWRRDHQRRQHCRHDQQGDQRSLIRRVVSCVN
jgi:hypothetical protein